MATRKYKKQRKGNLSKKSLGKKKRSMKKRGKSLKKRGGDMSIQYYINDNYTKYQEFMTREKEKISEYKESAYGTIFLNNKFMSKPHGSCRKVNVHKFTTERIQNCEIAKVLFYKYLLETFLKETVDLSNRISRISEKAKELKEGDKEKHNTLNALASKIETGFIKMIIGYATKIEDHAKNIEELEEVGIEKENEKFKMVEPLLNYNEEANALVTDIMNEINQKTNLTNVIIMNEPDTDTSDVLNKDTSDVLNTDILSIAKLPENTIPTDNNEVPMRSLG